MHIGDRLEQSWPNLNLLSVNIVQIFHKYCAKNRQILRKNWANIGQILQKLGKQCANISQILEKYWPNIGQSLYNY